MLFLSIIGSVRTGPEKKMAPASLRAGAISLECKTVQVSSITSQQIMLLLGIIRITGRPTILPRPWHCNDMNADRVEVSWDEQKRKWLIRIRIGGEVIGRYSEQPQDIDHITLQTEAVDLAAEEGYTVSRAEVVLL